MVEVTDTKFGRYRVLEPMENLSLIHVRTSKKVLKVSDFEPKVAVLDQEDFHAQGINVATIVPGADSSTDALGSCTANTSLEALSLVLSASDFHALCQQLGVQPNLAAAGIYDNVVAVERAAIGFYHGDTDQMNDSSQQWPPTDCGSTGLYCVKFMKKLGLKIVQHIASGADSAASLLQQGALMLGTPWLKDWMNPKGGKNDYFIDGNGSLSTLNKQIQNGVAGGHEISITAIEKLTIHASTGLVDPFNTVVRIRNHWDSSWADHGSCRAHLSTFTSGPLAKYADMRQVLAA
jgi:hypothetical protein